MAVTKMEQNHAGTRDYRWFAAVFFIFRLNMIWLLFVKDHTVATNIIVGIFILQTTLTAALQPYKSYVTHYNVVNVVFLLFLTLSTISFLGVIFSSQMSPQSISYLPLCAVQFPYCMPSLSPATGFTGVECLGQVLLLRFNAWRRNCRDHPGPN